MLFQGKNALLLIGTLSLIFLVLDIEGACEKLCNAQGTCNIYGECECNDGYLGADCSYRYCPYGTAWADEATDIDTAHAEVECSNRGECDRETGECSCMDGFTGIACQRLKCKDNCNGNGVCISMGTYANDYRSKESDKYTYSEVWDSSKIYGCVCDLGYTGYDCSQMECPKGDDPLSNNQVNEVQMVKCFAESGSFVLFFEGKESNTIQTDATPDEVAKAIEAIPGVGHVKVIYSFGGEACSRYGANVMSIEFRTNFGPLPAMVAFEENLNLGGYIEISATESESITDYANRAFQPIKGTKENDWCANRGLCSFLTGECECFDTNGDEYGSSDGYGNAGTLGECGFALTTIANCPGEIACSGHGMCDEDSFRCYCASGWGGGDCSERTCEKNLAWFDYPYSDEWAHKSLVDCSNMGVCDIGTGECKCAEGFFGSSCQYMACGGGIENTCSGHGQCLSMSKLAIDTDYNGDATEFTYGADPNEPTTWDADRIFGCKCDDGWEGYDCSKRKCQWGDDPGTYDDWPELQLLLCTGDEGTFDLTFRQQILEDIPWNTTAQLLEEDLESLTTLHDITISLESSTGTINGDSSVCTADGTTLIHVEFTGTPGDVPPITVDYTNLYITATSFQGSFNTYNSGATDPILNRLSKDGTTEVAECNNRGWCNHITGRCECFAGFTSSDGSGNYGENNDCGFRKPTAGALLES